MVDQDYVDNYTVGFEELKERAARTPEWAAEITGVSAQDIRKLAREMATEQPVGIRIGGVALERHYGGGPDNPGGRLHPGADRRVAPCRRRHHPVRRLGAPYKFDVICRPDLIPEGTRVVSNLQIGGP